MSLRINTLVTIIQDIFGKQVGSSQLFCIMVPFFCDSLFTTIITIFLPLPFLCLVVSLTKNGKTLKKLVIQGGSELRERERCGLPRKIIDTSPEIW